MTVKNISNVVMIVYCGKCGFDIQDEVKFCPRCGARVSESESPAEDKPSDTLVPTPAPETESESGYEKWFEDKDDKIFDAERKLENENLKAEEEQESGENNPETVGFSGYEYRIDNVPRQNAKQPDNQNNSEKKSSNRFITVALLVLIVVLASIAIISLYYLGFVK